MATANTNLQDETMRELSDIRCLAEFGKKGVHDLDIEREKYDILFSMIDRKAEKLENKLEPINATVTLRAVK